MKLFTRDFLCICVANFMLFFGFYAVLTLLPFYMKDELEASQQMIGFALTAMTLASVTIRPIGGYIYDNIQRRPLYLGAYLLFVLVTGGFAWASFSALIIVMRMVQGAAFGTATVGGYAIVADLLPKERIGEGVGYYGLANTLAMCLSPMCVLSLKNTLDYQWLFLLASLVSAIGLFSAFLIQVPKREMPKRRSLLTLDNLFVLKGFVPALCFLLAAIPYGMTTAYMALYARDLGLGAEAGLFFTSMGIGLGVSRVFGGKIADKVDIRKLITAAFILCVFTYLMIASFQQLGALPLSFLLAIYLFSAMLVGVVYGTLHPSINKLMLMLTTADHRGAASSTYLTGFDLGIGVGMLVGGLLAGCFSSYGAGYLLGAVTTFVALVVFWVWTHIDSTRVSTHSPLRERKG